MIAVYTLDGTELQLAAGSDFTINLVSTVFNYDDQFLGSSSYPVTLAYTPQNNKALEMANRLENRIARQDIQVSVRILGQHWKRCTLSFTLGNNGYSAFLKIDNGAFGNLIKNKLLPEVFTQANSQGAQELSEIQFTYSAADTLAYLNQSVQEPGQHPVYFFPLRNRGLFGSGSGDEPIYDDSYQLVNPYTPGQGYTSQVNDTNNKKLFYTPFFSLTWILQQVCAFLGYQGAGDLFQDPQVLDKVVYNTGFVGQADIFAPEGLKLKPARHLPSISIADLFKKLRTHYKLAIYFDGDTRTAYFNYGKNLLRTRERVDISGHIKPELSIKSDLPTGYQLVQPVDQGDKLFKDYPYIPNLNVGSLLAPQSVDNFIGTVFTKLVPSTLLPGSSWRIPTTDQTGNGYTQLASQNNSYNETGYNKNSFDLRIITYRGLQADSLGRPYPYASGDEYDSAEQGTTYGMSCWLAGDCGVLQLYNYDWYIFYLRTELVELTAYLPYRLLQQIGPLGLLAFRTPDQVLMPALLNDISFEASQSEKLLQAKLRAYVIYSQQDLPLPSVSKFTPATQVNQNQIYVRFNLNKFNRVTAPRRPDIILDLFYRGRLSFFSDEAAAHPLVVNNLKVTLHYDYQGANPRNYDAQDFVVVASGSVYDIPASYIDQTYHYSSSKDHWKKDFNIVSDQAVLDAGGYKVLL